MVLGFFQRFADFSISIQAQGYQGCRHLGEDRAPNPITIVNTPMTERRGTQRVKYFKEI